MFNIFKLFKKKESPFQVKIERHGSERLYDKNGAFYAIYYKMPNSKEWKILIRPLYHRGAIYEDQPYLEYFENAKSFASTLTPEKIENHNKECEQKIAEYRRQREELKKRLHPDSVLITKSQN